MDLNPTLVVDALEPGQRTSGIPELGNAASVRWNEAATEQAEEVVTMLLRDVMLGAFHAAVGATIPEKDRQIVINWLPDPTTLLLLDPVKMIGGLDVVYPGRGLSGLELESLSDAFPHLTFHSFEEVLS